MHIVNLPSSCSAGNSSSSINIVNKPCKVWASQEIAYAGTCSPYLIKHPDGLAVLVSRKMWVYSGGLFAFTYSKSLLWQWYLKKGFERQHQDIYLFAFLSQADNEFCCHLSKTCLGKPREILFHDMVFNGAFYQH